MFFDPVYLLFALPGFLLALWASFYTREMFQAGSRKRASSGMTGAEAALAMLHAAGLYDVRVEKVSGFLSDHYDPTVKVLRLSPDVYEKSTLSAVGVACHEAGHALQHAQGSISLQLRSQLVPMANIGSFLSYFVILAGFLFQTAGLVYLGAFLFAFVVLFSLVTLPVEWDASARAKKYILKAGIVTQSESEEAGKVLNAAFLTYVAAAVSSLLTLAYYLLRARSMND
ncbi:MAG: zinc metallopeptidase [Lentisphaeria bacterium]|nr:zinc metallopeptidase [Lentisphaeria bacterium]